ncbi:MAG: SemiSWEET transporter [Pseudomonadota bacterium]
MTEIIGLIAAILTTACYIPQVYHVIKERKTDGISLLAYSLLFCGVSLWLIYGIMKNDFPIIFANGVTLPLLSAVIFMKIKLRK